MPERKAARTVLKPIPLKTTPPDCGETGDCCVSEY